MQETLEHVLQEATNKNYVSILGAIPSLSQNHWAHMQLRRLGMGKYDGDTLVFGHVFVLKTQPHGPTCGSAIYQH